MRRILPLFVLLAANLAFAVVYKHRSATIACFVSNDIRQGLNEIDVVVDSLDLFPTMAKVVRFEPPEGVIGDDLVFDLDGKRQSYRFSAWDGSNYTLTASAKILPQEIGLDGIPLRRKFWINHVPTNVIRLSSQGCVNDEQMRKLSPVPSEPTRNIVIRLVDDDAKKSRILLKNFFKIPH